MGIVIINGKRYDSVTGLMMDNQVQSSHRAKQPELASQSTTNDQTPSWIGSFVDEKQVSAYKQARAQQSATIAPRRRASASSAHALPVVTNPATAITRPAATSAVSHGQPAQDTAHITRAARHTTQASRTLNRRFVRKPLDEKGNYAESVAVQRIRSDQMARELARPVQISESAQLSAATEATGDFIPVLTRRQATTLHRTAPTQPLSVRVAKAERERADQMARRNAQSVAVPLSYRDDEAAFDDRLERLSQILQNASNLDEQPQAHRAKASAAKARSTKAKHTAKPARTERNRSLADALPTTNDSRRSHKKRFAMPTILVTASAMAAIVAVAVYMVMPTVSVKIAANKAGIDAKSPYVPAGFSIDGTVAYQSGRVVINYRSKSGGDGYSVVQEKDANTSNDSLQQEVAAKNNGSYQQNQVDGKTVYSYRDIVTWQSNGVKYTINTNDYLDNNQISEIVKSIS